MDTGNPGNLDLIYDGGGVDVLRRDIQRVLRSRQMAYLTLADRTTKDHETVLARLDMEDDTLTSWLNDSDDDEEGEEEPAGPFTPAQQWEAVWRWMWSTIRGNLAGEQMLRFRLRGWATKAEKSLLHVQFVVKKHWSDPEELLEPEAPRPVSRETHPSDSPHMPVDSSNPFYAVSQAWRELGDYSLAYLKQSTGFSLLQLRQVNEQLKDSRNITDVLLGKVIDLNLDNLKVREEASQADKRLGNNHTLASQALNQGGQLLTLLLAGDKIGNPEMMQLLMVAQNNPALMDLLKDREVQQLLQDPQRLAQLAPVLKAMSQQQLAQPPEQAA